MPTARNGGLPRTGGTALRLRSCRVAWPSVGGVPGGPGRIAPAIGLHGKRCGAGGVVAPLAASFLLASAALLTPPAPPLALLASPVAGSVGRRGLDQWVGGPGSVGRGSSEQRNRTKTDRSKGGNWLQKVAKRGIISLSGAEARPAFAARAEPIYPPQTKELSQ